MRKSATRHAAAKGAGPRQVRRPPALSESPSELLERARAVQAQSAELRQRWLGLATADRVKRESNRRLSELYDFVPVPYFLLSHLGLVLRANTAAIELLGVDAGLLIGRPFLPFVSPADVRAVLNQVYAAIRSDVEGVEIRIRTRAGFAPVRLVSRRSSDPDLEGAVLHVALFDESNIKRAEEQKRVADELREASQRRERVAEAASKAKDEFLAMLSHELRTPLTPILAAADSLARESQLAPKDQVKIDIIRRNIRSEVALIDDLLDVARITRAPLPLTRRPTDLAVVLSEVAEGWVAPLDDRSITLRIETSATRTWVHGDARRLAQVFRNLLNNSAKFTDAGGEICVRTEDLADRVRVAVSDTGIGMTADEISGLFRPFVRHDNASSRQGLGLGLVISRAIVEGHEGYLNISSDGPGKGTTVSVEIPAIPRPAAGIEPPLPTETLAAPSGTSVLLVEDDRDTAQMLAMLLESQGFHVRTARSLGVARSMALDCDVIVSDISLPDGSGLDLMRDIKGTKRAIALSGYGSAQDVQRSLDAGFDEHLVKPVDLDVLVAAVHRLAARRS